MPIFYLKLCELLKATVCQRHAKLKAATFSCALSQSMIAVRHLVLYKKSDYTLSWHVHFLIFSKSLLHNFLYYTCLLM